MGNFREKAIFVWNDAVIGDADKITGRLLEAGFQAAYLHCENLSGWRTSSRVALAKALQSAGIHAYLSAAVYGRDPAGEGRQAAEIVNDLCLDGAVFDIEAGLLETAADAPSRTRALLQTYAENTARPAACCWWPFYRNWNKPFNGYHNKLVLQAAMERCEVGIPMAYWSWGDAPDRACLYLDEVFEQWRELTDKPMVPAGRAYIGNGGTATAEAVLAYEARARELGALGISWWSMEHAVKLPEVWDALSQTPGFTDDESGGGSMFENNALSLYIKSDYKVTDWDALAASVDGAVFLRAAYVPLSAFVDPATGKTIQIPNYDTARTDDDMLREDADYRSNRAKAKAKGLRVVTVIEYNPYYDKDSNFDGNNQVAQIKRILSGLDDARGDALCVQIMYNQWIENSKITTIPAANFKKGASKLFEDLYDAFYQTIYGWSQAGVIKYNSGGYNYLEQFVTWLDIVNSGEPTWPFGFTYLPAAWKQVWKTNAQTLREAVSLAPALTTSEADSSLRIGSFTGWGMKNRAGNMYNHGFYALFGCYLPFVRSAAGAAIMVEPIIIDTDKVGWFLWMGWSIGPVTDTVPPSTPGAVSSLVAGSSVVLSWAPATDNVGVTGYGIWRDGEYLQAVTGNSFTEDGVPSGAHVYQLDAFDAAGNHSARVEKTVTVGSSSGGDVGRAEFEDLQETVARIDQWIKSYPG